MITRKTKIKDIICYTQGHYRCFLFYKSILKWLIRKHIREQIAYRIDVMNPQCYSEGSCVMCGCTTTALQMCNKSCDGLCYPIMMSERQWYHYTKSKTFIDDKSNTWEVIFDKNNNYISTTKAPIRLCLINQQ